MALSIVNNSTAIGAQGSVNNANNSLTKTIKALSTGLRINSASDDASGLAVSEKLRAQISGLSKAATNAQDAISMLQTAEGAMGSMTSMVQRIRELAVQAGDPGYTANDRAMLQLEVDQLKEEIDRVSSSAEFNTKKLLNGDASALWSASNDDIEAIVKGAAVEGNYKVTYNVDPGQNSVYKSNIMRLGEGEMSYDINVAAGNMSGIDNIKGMMREEDVNITFGKLDSDDFVLSSGSTLSASHTGNYDYIKANTAGGTISTTQSTFYIKTESGEFVKFTVKTSSSGATINGASISAGKSTTINIDGVDYKFIHTGGTTLKISAGGTVTPQVYTVLSAGSTVSSGTTILSKSSGAGVIGFTGKNDGVISSAGLTMMKNGKPSYVEMEVTSDAYGKTGAQTFQMRIRTRDAETGVLSDWEEITIDKDGKVVGDNSLFTEGTQLLTKGATEGQLKKGDKILAQVGGNTELGTVKDLYDAKKNGTLKEFGTIKYDDGPAVVFEGITDSKTAKTHTVYTAQMDEAGNVYYGQFDLSLGKGQIATGVASIDILGEGDNASRYTKLSQIADFTNADGRNVLDNTQEISIYAGNGKIAKVTLEGSDTIADLESKLTSAIVDQLGLGADTTNPNASEINNNLVKFVEDKDSSGDRAVKGTFVIQGAALGDDSNLTFVGDEGVLAGLGITQIQEAQDSALNVRITDAHTGEFIGEDVVTDGRLRNVITGVDLDIKPESAANVRFDETLNKMVFEAKAESTVAYLHIKDNSTKAAIGANEGQTLDISIGRLDTVSMGIKDVNVATLDDAQKSITKLDMALEQISKARATAGAQMNRLEYTINNLNTTRENMVAAESRIRDLDIAQASSSLTSNQVIMQSATAMLAQANQIPSYAMQLLG